jgi:hypothetical protein
MEFQKFVFKLAASYRVSFETHPSGDMSISVDRFVSNRLYRSNVIINSEMLSTPFIWDALYQQITHGITKEMQKPYEVSNISKRSKIVEYIENFMKFHEISDISQIRKLPNDAILRFVKDSYEMINDKEIVKVEPRMFKYG